MKDIHEHYVEESLLPGKANILDLGCRGFQFTNYFRDLGHKVHAVDIDVLEGDYHMVAISYFNGKAGISKNSNDPQATKMKLGNEIDCYTLKAFSQKVGVRFWDLIKIDIEGAEYEVIMSLTEPPAKQLSIEFHLHTGIYTDVQMREMEAKLSQWYNFASHEKTAQHGAGFNYWNSLFILK